MIKELDISLCDAQLTGYAWDVLTSKIELKITDADNSIKGIVCCWISDFHFQQNRPGPMLSWEGRITIEETGEYKLQIDFADEGELLILCNEIEIIKHENPTIAAT